MEAKVEETQDPRIDPQDQDVFATEEIKIEEMAIDGICGVY
jgi:mycofactocin precursor